MLRTIATIALLALAAGVHAGAPAERVVPLAVGKAEVRIALPDGYVRASEAAPTMFSAAAAALPPAIRLVEAVMAEADLKRALAGQDLQQPYVQVQAPRDAEAIDLTAADWRQMMPLMAAQLGAVDLTEKSQSLQDGAGERMGKALGADVAIRFGEVGTPQVYSQADDVIRYGLRLPISGSVDGKAVDMVLDCAGAMLVLNGKLLTINVYLRQDAQGDNLARVRATLDAVVARARALNAAAAG